MARNRHRNGALTSSITGSYPTKTLLELRFSIGEGREWGRAEPGGFIGASVKRDGAAATGQGTQHRVQVQAPGGPGGTAPASHSRALRANPTPAALSFFPDPSILCLHPAVWRVPGTDPPTERGILVPTQSPCR